MCDGGGKSKPGENSYACAVASQAITARRVLRSKFSKKMPRATFLQHDSACRELHDEKKFLRLWKQKKSIWDRVRLEEGEHSESRWQQHPMASLTEPHRNDWDGKSSSAPILLALRGRAVMEKHTLYLQGLWNKGSKYICVCNSIHRDSDLLERTSEVWKRLEGEVFLKERPQLRGTSACAARVSVCLHSLASFEVVWLRKKPEKDVMLTRRELDSPRNTISLSLFCEA